MTLREAVINVIDGINESIAKSPEENTTEGKRKVCINNNDNEILVKYANIEYDGYRLENTWLWAILKALEKDKRIFRFMGENGHGYNLQA